MKYFLYLGLVTISFAIGDCLRCYHCYNGDYLHSEQIDRKANLFGTSPPNVKCDISNGHMTGPTCETSIACVNLNAEINEEKADYHFCSRLHNPSVDVGVFTNKTRNGNVKITYDKCSEDLCNYHNGASSMFTITSILIITVLSLSFFT